jgi:hypothetical protein
MSSIQRTVARCFSLSALVLASGTVLPCEGADPPLLGRYIPAGLHFFASWRPSAERQHLLEPFTVAWRRLLRSGIGRDILDLATLERSEEERSRVLAVVERVVGLLGTPSWSKLAEKEVALAFRLAAPLPEYLVVFHVAAESAAERHGELKKLLEGLAEFAPDFLAVRDVARNGATVSSLAVEGQPFQLIAATKRDLVLLSTSEALAESVLALRDAEPAAARSMAASPEFQKALAGLPAPQDSVFYIDVAGYLEFFRSYLDMAAGLTQGDPTAGGVLGIALVVLDELARMRAVAGVERTEDRRLVQASRVSFSREAPAGFLEELLRGREPLGDVGRLVPVDARSFQVTRGLDWLKIYDAGLSLLRERLPQGPELLEEWESIQKRIGFHLRDDLLVWIEGGCGYVRLPAGSGDSSSVLMLRVRDNEKAERAVDSAIEKMRAFLESRGQGVTITRLPGLGEKFHEIRFAALPWLRPVVGLAPGILIVGGRRQAVEKMAATFRGEAPGIRDNPRFSAFGIPESSLHTAYYEEVEDSWGWLADLAGTAGFCVSLLPERQETRALIRLGAILTKLSAFLRDIEVPFEQAGWSRYDAAERAIFSQAAVRLRAEK